MGWGGRSGRWGRRNVTISLLVLVVIIMGINHNFDEDREPKRIETFVLQTLNTGTTEANS